MVEVSQDTFLEAARAEIGVDKVIDGHPQKLQVLFLTDQPVAVDIDSEDKVDLVVCTAILGIAVLDRAEEALDGRGCSEFLGDLADQRGLHPLARVDVAAREEHPLLATLTDHEEVPVASQYGSGDDLGGASGRAGVHGVLLVVVARRVRFYAYL